MRAALLVAVLALGCKKQQEAPPAPKPAIGEVEVKRAGDACQAYVAKVCACPALAEQCKLARALPEVIEVSMEVAMSADGTRKDALQAADTIRKTVATCVQESQKLVCP